MLQATHITLHSCACDCLLLWRWGWGVRMGVGVCALRRGNDEREEREAGVDFASNYNHKHNWER